MRPQDAPIERGAAPEPVAERGAAPPREHLAPTPGLDITIVHAEKRLVVLDKPPGMLSVPGRGDDKADCARVRVGAMFPHASGPMTCHRLDMDTSGLLVMGLDAETHRKLSGQFEKRRVRKWYVALLDGSLPDALGDPTPGDPRPRGAINLAQCVDWANRPLQKIDWSNGKHAKTDWIKLGDEPYRTPSGREITATRVEMRPITGRTHQLRLAAAAEREIDGPGGVRVRGGLGIPILGDRLYGDATRAPRLLLHAQRLGFWHPFSGDWVKFESQTPF